MERGAERERSRPADWRLTLPRYLLPNQFWARFHRRKAHEVRAYATRIYPRSFQESILLPDVGRVPCSCHCHCHSKPSYLPP